jgi:hypothetical protein
VGEEEESSRVKAKKTWLAMGSGGEIGRSLI